MSSLMKLSNALDSKEVGQVLVALHSLPDDLNLADSEACIAAFLHELMTWNLTNDPETSEAVIRHMMSLLTRPKTIRDFCGRILTTQCSVAVPIAVQIMMTEGWKLSLEDCETMGNRMEKMLKMEELNGENSFEYANRLAANCTILRFSGVPNKIISNWLENGLIPMNQPRKGFPIGLLHEIAILLPFHPLLDSEDQKYTENVFLIPRVVPDSHRFRHEIDEFCRFVASESTLRNQNSRALLCVFWRICSRMEQLPELGAAEIEPVVSLWMTVFRLLDDNQISVPDIQETGKLVAKTAARFEISRRPLFLKHFLRKIGETKDSDFTWEPHFVAIIIDTFKRNAFGRNSSEFFEELGDFWTLVHQIKYNDVYYASAYFGSVWALAEGQAFFRLKKELMRAVYEKILKPMHNQIVDFVRVKELENKKAVENGEHEMLIQHKNLGSDAFNLISTNFKLTEETIKNFLDE